ncbi:MAG: EscU/YscU/HrcU family type III secretion system export apparatus switch protein [Acidimicrobiia bacterium]
MAGDRKDRTEKPTAKRKKELREQGTVARSQEVVTWVSAIAAVGMLGWVFRSASGRLSDQFHQSVGVISHPNTGSAFALLKEGFMTFALVAVPLGLGMLVAGMAANIGQVGFRPSAKVLRPKFKRLNPISGIKRMVSLTTLWETIKAILKVAFIFAVCWPAMTALAQGIAQSGGSFSDIASIGGNAAMQILRNILVAGVVIGAADYIVTRRKYLSQARMTKQEVKEEYKQQEGDQMVRATRKARMRAMSRNRAISLVTNADVVLMNPTHYAVALRYDPTKGAPEVLAKGAGNIALQIRELALDASVPVVEDPPLARALFRMCEAGDLIPGILYEAIARILAFVFGLRRRGMALGVSKVPGGETLLPAELEAADRKMVARHAAPRVLASASAGGPVGPVRMD